MCTAAPTVSYKQYDAVVQDVVYSFPVTCKDGEWSIVQGLSIDEFSAAKLKATGEELVEEKQLALQCLSE